MPFANHDGVRIYYEVEGAGTPLLLVHGMGNSHLEYRLNGYVEPLAKEHLVIAVDVRGHGQSDKPHAPEVYTPELIAGDLVQILDDLGLATVHYWGYSMGTRVGWLAMVPHAGARLRSLIFGGGPRAADPGAAGAASPTLSTWARIAELGMEQGIALLEERWGPYPPDQRAAQLANDPVAIYAAVRGFNTWPAAPVAWAAWTRPALIYAGDKDPVHDQAQAVAASLPRGRFVSYPGLDHIQAVRRSDLVLPVATAFLREVDAAG